MGIRRALGANGAARMFVAEVDGGKVGDLFAEGACLAVTQDGAARGCAEVAALGDHSHALEDEGVASLSGLSRLLGNSEGLVEGPLVVVDLLLMLVAIKCRAAGGSSGSSRSGGVGHGAEGSVRRFDRGGSRPSNWRWVQWVADAFSFEGAAVVGACGGVPAGAVGRRGRRGRLCR